MHEPNREKLLAHLRANPTWKVLDVGGGEQPCMLATHVIDKLNYTSSGDQGVIGKTEECRFSADTWTVADICEPWPYEDNEFDFTICSNVLEDVRDPIFVLKELSRVSRTGYIEYPRVGQETKEGVDEHFPGWPGYAHHKWFVSKNIEIRMLIFLQKIIPIISHHEDQFKSYSDGFEPIYWQNEIKGGVVDWQYISDYLSSLKKMSDG